jgi:hypothetical protein
MLCIRLAISRREVLFFTEEKIPKEPSNYQELLSVHEKHVPIRSGIERAHQNPMQKKEKEKCSFVLT